jgi:hypothetical protein
MPVHDLDFIFRFIVNYKREHDGNAPSYDEIMAACEISSKSMMSYYLNKLAKEGRIKFGAKNSNRTIQVVGGHWTWQP